MHSRMDRLIKAMDTNGHGKVVLSEVNAFVFKRLDKRGSAVLEADEWVPPYHCAQHRPSGVVPTPMDQ